MIRTVEYKEIDVDKLTPLDEAANYPTDEDDRAPIDVTTVEIGQISPVVVRKAATGDGYEIIDGIGRWEAARKARRKNVECRVVTCDDPRSVVLAANSACRKHMDGGRVLAYLEMHKREVLLAAQAFWFVSGGGVVPMSTTPPYIRALGGLPITVSMRLTSGHDLPPDLQPFTANSIAKALKVSKRTVQKAIELLCCREAGCDNRGMKLDAAGTAKLWAAYDCVLKGYTPVNRWAPRLQGDVTTEGKARADTDEARLAINALKTLNLRLMDWGNIRWPNAEKREQAEDLLRQCIMHIPGTFNGTVSDYVNTSYNTNDARDLVRRLKEKCR